MTVMPPSPFTDSSVPVCTLDEPAVPNPSQGPGTAADIQLACSSAVERGSLNAIVAGSNPAMPAIDCIGEIFAGARKLEPIEMWFENTAYPPEWDVYYDLLCQFDKPETSDLVSIPDEASFMIEIGPPPLFLMTA